MTWMRWHLRRPSEPPVPLGLDMCLTAWTLALGGRQGRIREGVMLVLGKAGFGDGWEHVTTDLQDNLMLKLQFRPFFILPHVLDQSVSTQPSLLAHFLSASSKTQFSFCGCFFVSFPPVQTFFQVLLSPLLPWWAPGAAVHISCCKHHLPAGGSGGLSASWAWLPGLCASWQGRDSTLGAASLSQPVPSLSPHSQAPVVSRSFSAHCHPWVFCLFLLWSAPRLTSCQLSQESRRPVPPEPWGAVPPAVSCPLPWGQCDGLGRGQPSWPRGVFILWPWIASCTWRSAPAPHSLSSDSSEQIETTQNPIKHPVTANTEWPQAFPSPGTRSQASPCGRFSNCATPSHRFQSPSAGHRVTLISHPVCRPNQMRDQFQDQLIFFRWPSSCPHLN